MTKVPQMTKYFKEREPVSQGNRYVLPKEVVRFANHRLSVRFIQTYQ